MKHIARMIIGCIWIVLNKNQLEKWLHLANISGSLGSLLLSHSLKKKTGLKIFTVRSELQYSSMRLSALTLCLSALSFGNLLAISGKSHYKLFIISQKEKSATVKQPKYQSSSLHFCQNSMSLGSSLFSQQYSGGCSGLPLGLLLLMWQMRAIILSLMSYLLLNWSILSLSLREVPSNERAPARRMMYSIIPCCPVTTKSPCLRKGSPLKTQSFAQVRSQCSHYCGVKNWSRQGRPRCSQSRRQTCALARIPKQPITMHSSESQAFIIRQPQSPDYFQKLLLF